MIPIGVILGDLLRDIHKAHVDVESFVDSGFTICVIRQRLSYIKRIITASPVVWVINKIDDTNNEFGVSIVSQKRFKELQELSNVLRRFPFEEVNVMLYKDNEVMTAIEDIHEAYKDVKHETERDRVVLKQFMQA